MLMPGLPKHIKVVEVGPRDGLQNEPKKLSIETRSHLIALLADAGLKQIEIGSFVSHEKIPQLADTDQLFDQLILNKGIAYSVLIFNEKGLDDALRHGVKHIAIGTSASSSFTQKNIHCTPAESLKRFERILPRAQQAGISVRAYLSCVLGCPYERKVPYSKTAEFVERLYQLGCEEISLGDTIGVGTANQVHDLLNVVSELVPLKHLAVHFHDTYGQALVNVYEAIRCGVTTIDASVSGLGGCPYAKGASGNLATEDLCYCLQGLGIETGINLEKLLLATRFISDALGRAPSSKVALAMLSE